MLKVSRQSVSKLIAKDAPCVDGYICTEDDIRYALPEYLLDIGKVERAIELAKDDLVNKYGLIYPDTFIFDESKVVAENCAGQMTLLDLLFEELLRVT